MTHPHLYINLSLFLKWFTYIYYVYRMFYSYLLKLTEWLMLVISGIEFTTCFKNMPMQRTIPENITAAKAIVKIVIIIINLFKIYYLLFLKPECKVNIFYRITASFAEKYHCNMFFLIWVNHLFLALKMTFCYRTCCFCGNNLYISFFSLYYVCNKIGLPVRW